MKKSFSSFFICIFSILVFSSCSTAEKATPSGFLNNYSDMKDGVYFTQEQIKNGVDFSQFKQVKVAPVDTGFLNDKTSCEPGEIENLAHEFRQDVEAQLKKEGFTVTSNLSGDTLVIQIALTNVEPPNVALNVGLEAAGAFSPVPLPLDDDGKTAFEGKITRGTTGEVLVRFSEERSGAGDEMSIETMTVGNYQRFTNTQAVFNGWAKTIAEMVKDLTQKVDPATKSQTGKQSRALTKQLIGMVA